MRDFLFVRSGPVSRCATIVLAGTVACTALVAPAEAQVTVKDHATTSSLWDSTVRVSNWDDTGSTIDFFAASAFTGNGADIVEVEGIYWSVSSMNVPNGADWPNIDFRVIFYDSDAAYQADPRNGTASFVVNEPTNADWLVPVATFVDPKDGLSYDLLRFTFDVSGLGITTTAGVEQLIAITPTGDSLSDGETGMMLSTGGAGAVGTELDRWTSFFLPQTGPDTLQNLGAPDDYFAYRVVLGDAPCPADSDGSGTVDVSDLLALLAKWGACPPPCPEDTDGSGVVDVSDLLALLAAWGPCP